MRIGLGFSKAIAPRSAAQEAAKAALAGGAFGAAERALVFATSAFGGELEAVLDALADRLEGVPMHGACVPGVFAGGKAADRNPGLVVAALAGAELRTAVLDELEVDDPDAAGEVIDHLHLQGGAGAGDLLFVASDFAHHDATRFFAELARCGAPVVAVGVAGTTGAPSVWSGDERPERGLLALLLRGEATARVELVPRCRPIDRARVVTRVRDNWVSGIGEQDAVEVLRAAARAAHLPETPEGLRRLVVEVAHPAASALLRIAGVDFDRGAVLIPGSVAAGDRIRIAVLDAVASRENLERLEGGGGRGLGVYLSGTGSDAVANGEFAGEARWFAERNVIGLASPQIFGPTGLAAGAAQPLPACSVLARSLD